MAVWRRTSWLSLNLDFNASQNGPFKDVVELRHYMRKPRQRFIHGVNSVMDQHHSGNIDSFRVRFFLKKRSTPSIDKWVKFAMSSRALQMLELDFSLYTYLRKNLLAFSHHCRQRDYVGLKSLKELSLRDVGVTGEDVECLLFNAPLLERLAVYH